MSSFLGKKKEVKIKVKTKLFLFSFPFLRFPTIQTENHQIPKSKTPVKSIATIQIIRTRTTKLDWTLRKRTKTN